MKRIRFSEEQIIGILKEQVTWGRLLSSVHHTNKTKAPQLSLRGFDHIGCGGRI
jgi:hypothetical protein